MTDKDRLLVQKAKSTHYTNWGEVFRLAEEADFEDTAEQIRRHGRYLYHLEEYKADVL